MVSTCLTALTKTFLWFFFKLYLNSVWSPSQRAIFWVALIGDGNCHSSSRQKCKINWQIYGKYRVWKAKWNWYAIEGGGGILWVDFCLFVWQPENVATKYLNIPKRQRAHCRRSANEPNQHLNIQIQNHRRPYIGTICNCLKPALYVHAKSQQQRTRF